MDNVEKVASAASGSSGDRFQQNELQKPLQSSKMDKENQEKFDKPVSFKIIVLGESGVGKNNNITNHEILDFLKLFMSYSKMTLQSCFVIITIKQYLKRIIIS